MEDSIALLEKKEKFFSRLIVTISIIVGILIAYLVVGVLSSI